MNSSRRLYWHESDPSLMHDGSKEDSQVLLRGLPYPYRAMLAICSDLDETPNRHVYREIMRFLNTAEETAMGPGVDLEVGNTIYFDMPPDQFAYWNTDDAGRDMIRTLIQSGHIDCLHSYGDLATTRSDAARALDELTAHDCRLQTWIDHGVAPTNFDPDILDGHGAEIGHKAYHADLTMDYGIQYVWRGRVTSIIGQDVPAQLGGLFNLAHPLASGRTLLKEVAKRRLARNDNPKYMMHGPNKTLRVNTLPDGRRIYEFMRSNPHWGGVSSCDEGRHIGEVLTSDVLDRLIERGGTCVLYTHLGKIDNPTVPFNPKAVIAFRRLSEMFRRGQILVTTTRRLLGYRRVLQEMAFGCRIDERGLHISVDIRKDQHTPGEVSDADLSGLTFYVPDPEITSVTLNGREVPGLNRNTPDHTGRASVSIDWPLLEFPKL